MTLQDNDSKEASVKEAAGYPAGIGHFVALEQQKAAQFSPEHAFEKSEYDTRLQRLKSAMMDEGIDIVLLTAPDACAWMHGFRSRVYPWQTSTYFPPTAATVVHAQADAAFYIDDELHRDLVQRTSVITDFREVPATGLTTNTSEEAYVDFLIAQLRDEGWHSGSVGFEFHSSIPSYASMELYRDRLTAAGYHVVDATAIIRGVRRVKSVAEIAQIERAQRAVDNGIRAVQKHLRPGMSEFQGHAIYMRGVLEAGGEQSAIHDSVYAGPPESFGHEMSSQRYRFTPADYIHVDGAAASESYHARACRVLTFGPPRSELQRLNDICAGAYEVLTTFPEAGMPFSELDQALSEYFRKAGVSEDIGFGGGYELGLSPGANYVGEFVWGSGLPERGGTIEAGLVTNFESLSFVAVIDTVVFEEKGARTLSALPFDILQIDE